MCTRARIMIAKEKNVNNYPTNMNINIFLEKNWKELEIIDSKNSKMNIYSYCWTKFLLILAYSFPKSIIRKIREHNYSHYSDSFQNISLEKLRSIRIILCKQSGKAERVSKKKTTNSFLKNNNSLRKNWCS